MEFSIIKFIEEFILPPGVFFVLLSIGLVLLFYKIRFAKWMVSGVLVVWYFFSTQLVSSALITWIEPDSALTTEEIKTINADAIIVLAAGFYDHAPEFNGPTVSKHTLERLRYAARLHRQTKLPIIVSGGVMRSSQKKSLAVLMRDALKNDFNVTIKYLETNSKTTYENAKFTAEITHNNNLTTSYLVTHAGHMPRSVEAFEQFNVNVIPAPMGFSQWSSGEFSIHDILPSAKAQFYTAIAMHEIIGRMWYRIRYY